MRLVFCGAAHEVTGSCHFLEVGPTKLLEVCTARVRKLK